MYSSYHLLIDTFFAMLPRYWSFCCKFRAKFRIAVSLPKFALNFVFTWNNGYVGSAKNTHTIYVPGWQTIKAYGSMNIYTYCIHTHVVAWDLCKLLRMWFDLLVWSCQHHGLTSQCLILLWWIRKGSGCLGSLASTSPLRQALKTSCCQELFTFQSAHVCTIFGAWTSFRLFATTQTHQLPQICVAIPPPPKKKTVTGQVAVSRSPMQRQITAARYCIPSADWCQTEKSTGAPTAKAEASNWQKCARHNHVSTKSWHWVAKTRLVVRPSIILKFREILYSN